MTNDYPPYHLEPVDIKIYGYHGVSPMQAEGEINGRKFYFRSRYNSYSLRVAPVPGMEIDLLHNDGYYRKYDYKTEEPFAASLMERGEAVHALMGALEDYLMSLEVREVSSEYE